MPSLRGAGSCLRAARETKKLPAGDRSSGTQGFACYDCGGRPFHPSDLTHTRSRRIGWNPAWW